MRRPPGRRRVSSSGRWARATVLIALMSMRRTRAESLLCDRNMWPDPYARTGAESVGGDRGCVVWNGWFGGFGLPLLPPGRALAPGGFVSGGGERRQAQRGAHQAALRFASASAVLRRGGVVRLRAHSARLPTDTAPGRRTASRAARRRARPMLKACAPRRGSRARSTPRRCARALGERQERSV